MGNPGADYEKIPHPQLEKKRGFLGGKKGKMSLEKKKEGSSHGIGPIQGRKEKKGRLFRLRKLEKKWKQRTEGKTSSFLADAPYRQGILESQRKSWQRKKWGLAHY